jgi:hypothetical protein
MKFGHGVGGLRVYISFTRIEDQTRINAQRHGNPARPQLAQAEVDLP